MHPPAASPALRAVRTDFRACARRVLLRPADFRAHAERLGVALQMPGAEPAQGALADLLLGCADTPAAHKQAALDGVRPRLNRFIARSFEPYAAGAPFPRCSRLATRWSVLALASLDVPRRSLRCSSDDSRQLAAAALNAWWRDDLAAQDEFLEHCTVCDDGLAFLLARREILRQVDRLPPAWEQVCHQLQQRALAA